MDLKQENELFKTLGRIEAKIHNLCDKDKTQKERVNKLTEKIDSKIDALPCAIQYSNVQTDLKKKLDLKLFFVAIGIAVTIVGSSFAYTKMVDNKLHDHEINIMIHHDHTKK